jgi:calcineurin-like phosphoesterase family protein
MLRFLDAKGERVRKIFPLPEENGLHTMHEYMVEKWNSVVKPQDYVYHLGDVTFQYHAAFNALMRRLNGKKRLIIGNHDKIWNPALIIAFEKAEYWKGFKEGNFTATHIPMRLDSLRDGAFNVHAHIHQNKMSDPHYINVCAEVRDYTPVHMDTILSEIKAVKG